MKSSFYECDTPFIPAHHQPSTLIDMVLGRAGDSHRLLRGTGLFYEDILTGMRRISPDQFKLLIDNACKLVSDEDLSFLFGQRLLPGHYGAASHALRNSASVQDALSLLEQLPVLLSPLMKPHLWYDDHYVWICWTDSCGLGARMRFMMETMSVAISRLSHELLGQRLPWEFIFAHERPRHIEQYWVHLGQNLRFGQPANLMRLPRMWASKTCPAALTTINQVVLQQSQVQRGELGFDSSLLDGIYHYLGLHVQQAPSLEQTAQAFGYSSATLKRKLSKHGTGFQQLLDQVRLHTAIKLYLIYGYSSEQVAAHLQFHDAANFRRSFKRWTGLAPNMLRKHFGL